MIEAETANQSKVGEVPSSQPGLAGDGLNNLIDADIETASREPGKVVNSDEVPTKLDPAYVEETLSSHYTHWEEGAGEAHRRLHRLLGRIYEWGPEVKRDVRLEAAIRARIEDRHQVKARPEKSGDELLLMLTVGFGKIANVTRSQWNKALLAAAQNSVPRNASELVEWLGDIGGVKTAGALFSADGDEKPAAFNFADYLNSLTDSEDRPGIDLSQTGVALAQGDQILIARSSGQRTVVEILGTLNDPKTVELVAKRHKANADRVDKLLWDVNRYALRAVGHGMVGKMTSNDVTSFAKAIAELIGDPATKQRFFDDNVPPFDVPEEAHASDRREVINSGFNIHDPGRYVKGAKQGALLPYVPDRAAWGKLTILEQLESTSRAYLNLHLKVKVLEPSELGQAIANERKRLADEEQAKSVKQVETV